MPKTELLPAFRKQVEEFLWSLWSELGVPGWERRHRSWWIDPEALLLFTATVETIDQRLRDEAMAWCLRHRDYLSTTRARSLLRAQRWVDPPQYQPQLGRFLATISLHRSLVLEEAVQPYGLQLRQMSGRASPPRAARLSLRLRSLLGVTAKAEILRAFLARPEPFLTATDLVNEGVGYTKRAVRDALEDLRMGAFVEKQDLGNRSGYRLLASRGLSQLMDPMPCFFPRWRPLLAVLRGLLDLTERIGSFRSTTRPIEIRRSLQILGPDIRSAGFSPPAIDVGSDAADEIQSWVSRFVEAIASDGGNAPAIWTGKLEAVEPGSTHSQ